MACPSSVITNVMLSEREKAELKRIIGKFVAQGRCLRPVHPDEVLQQVHGLKQTDFRAAEGKANNGLPTVTGLQ